MAIALALAGCEPNATAPTPLFELLKPEATGVTFANTLPEKPDFNILNYLYYYNGAGVAVGDIDGDGLPDRIQNAWATVNGVTSCQATWQRNDPTASFFQYKSYLTFGDTFSSRMPRLRWQGPNEPMFGVVNPGSEQADPSDAFDHKEGCALNGQVTAFHNSHPTPGICHDGATCTPGHYCPDGNTCPDNGSPNNRTYLEKALADVPDADAVKIAETNLRALLNA